MASRQLKTLSWRPAGRVVDEHEQGAAIATILEPSVIAAVNLDQFAKALTPQSTIAGVSRARW